MPGDSVRARPDTVRRDSLRPDSSGRARELVKWNETDSVMRALMEREGYSATRYQGNKVVFDAESRTLDLDGNRAAIGRGETVLVADSITYNDSTKMIVARGDTVWLRDPQQNAADVIARGSMRYSVASRRGSVTNISTSVETGQTWYLSTRGTAAFAGDTTGGGSTSFYARNGVITSCDDEVPDYHFQAKEIKLVSKNILVARPAVLYIGDVPVMWLPFIFQDMRSGRRSGVLTPRFGVSELFRNSPTYRRHVENIGYYFAISDYIDAQFAFDWRSGSRPSEGDPGWVRFNGTMQYRWLNRFLSGSLSSYHHAQRDGTTNTAVSWAHAQQFSQATSFNANVNYVTNTTVQRTTSFDPRQVLATIGSSANYQTKFGQTGLSIGGRRTQYPGREQVSQSFPTFSISSPTIGVTPWLDWTPSLSIQNDQEFNKDQGLEFNYRYFDNLAGARDSALIKANSRNTSANFSTPLKIGGFSLNTSFRASDREDDYPSTVRFIDPADTTNRIDRVFARRFRSEFDWRSDFSLPSIGQGALNITPFVNFENVHPGPFWVRTELSGGQFVHQSKRARGGVSVSPTLFALFPGFGAVTRFRHAITPGLSWGYAPKARVDEKYLRALNENPSGYLGANAQNMLTLNLSHVLEAKLRTRDTSSTAEARKIKVLAMNFSSFAYDFERARQTGRSGFATDRFSYDLTSDLLPSFSANVDYSLYEGSILTDSARFKPYRERIGASFTLNSESGIFAALNRVFGRAVRQGSPSIERVTPSADDAQANAVASTPSAGAAVRNRQIGVPPTKGWQAQFTFSSQRQRPPTGDANIVDFDPTVICRGLVVNPFQYQSCIDEVSARPQSAGDFIGTTAGGPFIRTPGRDNLESQMSFNITPKWSGTWGTNYDFQAKQFGSHSVTLQRQLHDWNAVFSFNQAQNGNFAFSFFIALTAQPDLKFNYDKQTYRPITR